MAIGDLITATDFNAIRTDVNSVLGTGLSGYGQTPRTTAVGVTDTVTSDNMQKLYLDLVATRVHQIGSVDTTVAIPVVGDLIAWDVSTDPNGIKKGLSDFISVKNNIAAFDAQSSGFPDANFTVSSASSSSRNGSSSPWGGNALVQSITHVVTFTFSNSSQIEYFFNAGGQIRFSATLASASGAKSVDWANMMSAMGTIIFDKWKTTSLNSSGTGSLIGYNSLSSVYQQVYIKTGSSVYSDNQYIITARKPTSTTIQFTVTFNDGDTGTSLTLPIDENVLGTMTSLIQTRNPNSSFTVNLVNYTSVSVNAPTVVTNTNL